MTIEMVVMFVVLIGVVSYVAFMAGGWKTNQHACSVIQQSREDERREWMGILEEVRGSHTKIEQTLRDQVQALAQQLATLRVNHGAVPDQDRFEQKPEPPKPYSQQLMSFLDAIEYEDARVLVEEDIERLRNEGYDDAHVYSIISDGGLPA